MTFQKLYCPECHAYLEGGDGECKDCHCGWKQPESSSGLAFTKELASLMSERFSMNPISCKLLNEKWRETFPDEVAVAGHLKALFGIIEEQRKRINALDPKTLVVELKTYSEFAIVHITSCSDDYAKGWIDGRNTGERAILKAGAAAGINISIEDSQ